jgi:fibronectin-binding autotransporter adhesin
MKKTNQNPKHYIHESLRFGSAGLCLLLAFLANNAKAQNAYFDVNGTTAGYGTAGGGSYSWDGNNWGTSGGTGATTAWTPGTFARFLGGGSYTVTVNADESMAGMFLDITGTTLTLNAAGVGDLRVSSAVQGFLTDGSTSTLIINAPIVGTGGVENENGGSLDLYGNNSYSGGTILGTSGGMNFNNNNSFGNSSGSITWGTTTTVLASQGTSAINIANPVVTVSGDNNIFVGGATAPTTFSGAWTLPAVGLTATETVNAGTPMTISGVISGAGNFVKAGAGTMILSGANLNTGTMTVKAGTLQLGAANTVATSSQVILAGGTLNPGGLNHTMSGTLSLTANSTIDYGLGASTVSFADSHAIAWTGVLNLANWSGGGGETGPDELQFGTSASGLTSAQLAEIEIDGNPASLGMGTLDPNGFLIIPEPSTAALGLMGALITMWNVRRRKA